MSERWHPSVTVAAVIEREGLFLLVEEHTAEGLRLNNPAGHLEQGESLEQGCVREVLEETAFAFTPQSLVGVYLSRFQRDLAQGTGQDPLVQDITYVRFAFRGALGAFDPEQKLDAGIVRTVWMTPTQIRESVARHRSPLVLQCMEDYLRGQDFPLGLVYTDPSIQKPLLSL